MIRWLKQAVYSLSFAIVFTYAMVIVAVTTYSRAHTATEFPAIAKPNLVHVPKQVVIHDPENGVVSLSGAPVSGCVLPFGR